MPSRTSPVRRVLARAFFFAGVGGRTGVSPRPVTATGSSSARTCRSASWMMPAARMPRKTSGYDTVRPNTYSSPHPTVESASAMNSLRTHHRVSYGRDGRRTGRGSAAPAVRPASKSSSRLTMSSGLRATDGPSLRAAQRELGAQLPQRLDRALAGPLVDGVGRVAGLAVDERPALRGSAG